MRIAVAGATGTIGKPVVDLARAEGHDVVEIARSKGVDLATGDGLPEALTGVEAVIDCAQSPGLGSEAAEWFTTEATNLGDAARAAGVRRSVLLSILGIDRTPDFPYYVAKVEHEKVFTEHAPGPVIVRATQFHDFVGNMLVWNGEPPAVWEFQSQPIATEEVAKVLLAQAVADDPEPYIEIAGPRPEHTVDQAQRLLHSRGDDTTRVKALPASPCMAEGSLLAGPDTRLLGPSYDEWLASGSR